jgi:hypothetical protein
MEKRQFRRRMALDMKKGGSVANDNASRFEFGHSLQELRDRSPKSFGARASGEVVYWFCAQVFEVIAVFSKPL